MLTPKVKVFEAPGPTRLTVTTTSAGWRICEEDDGRTVRAATCTDWHRVERAIARFLHVHQAGSDDSTIR